MSATSKTSKVSSKNLKATKPVKHTAVWESKTSKKGGKAPASKAEVTKRKNILREGLNPDKVQAVLEERTVTEQPKGYIPMKEVWAEAKKVGCSSSKVMKAIGGNRGMGEPRNADWRFVYYKGARWFPKGCLRQLPMMAKEKTPRKAPSAKKAAPKPVAKKVVPKGKALPAKKGSGLKHSAETKAPSKKGKKLPELEFDLKGGKGIHPVKKTARKVLEGGIPMVDVKEEGE